LKIQDKVAEVFINNFGYTPLKQRLADILNECWELKTAGSIRNMKEETGDLLASLIQLANECEWNVEELIENTLHKIQRRSKQYKSTGRKINVALFGGSFDPIHIGHEIAGKIILDYSKEIDEIWFTPCFVSLYGKSMTEPHHRLAMCNKITKTDGRFKVFDYEIKHKLGGETYFFLKKLLEDSLFTNYRFYFIIGSDTALSLPKWPNSKYLIDLIPFIVVHRPKVEISIKDAWFLRRPNCIYIEPEQNECIDRNIESTNARNIIISGADDKELESILRPDIINYIRKYKLYESKP